MVLVGYGINDNRLRVRKNVDCNTSSSKIASNKESVIVSLL